MECHRYLHLLDRTDVATACFVGIMDRIDVSKGSGRSLRRSLLQPELSSGSMGGLSLWFREAQEDFWVGRIYA